jgi:hypothetical protein
MIRPESKIMIEDERGYLIVPHEVATGADCDGCLVVKESGDVADIVCNYCCTLIETVPMGRARQRLMELASAEICSARCPHCGALNMFPGFRSIEPFICQDCGEGVSVERPVQ